MKNYQRILVAIDIYSEYDQVLQRALAAEQLARIGYTNVSVITCKMDEIHKIHLN